MFTLKNTQSKTLLLSLILLLPTSLSFTTLASEQCPEFEITRQGNSLVKRQMNNEECAVYIKIRKEQLKIKEIELPMRELTEKMQRQEKAIHTKLQQIHSQSSGASKEALVIQNEQHIRKLENAVHQFEQEMSINEQTLHQIEQNIHAIEHELHTIFKLEKGDSLHINNNQSHRLNIQR